MSKREGLVPKTITDKRGRNTTVYVRPEASHGVRSIPAVKTPTQPQNADPERDIIDDCTRRIHSRCMQLSGDEFRPMRGKMDSDDFLMAAKIAESPHAGDHMAFILQGRITPLGEKELTEWLTVMSRHFDDVMSSGALRGTKRDEIDAAGFIGAVPRLKYLECRRRGMDFKEYRERVDTEFTPEQELHLALLSASAWHSDMAGSRERPNGQHGPTQYLDDQDMLDFAFNGATREQVDVACDIIKRGGVTRFSEVEAVMNGSTVVPIADGWL